MDNKHYQVSITLEGSVENLAHTLLAMCRTLQVHLRYADKPLRVVDAPGYEDILIHSELKEI